jgi:hypothetical protein
VVRRGEKRVAKDARDVFGTGTGHTALTLAHGFFMLAATVR